jgi:hypothetical protein
MKKILVAILLSSFLAGCGGHGGGDSSGDGSSPEDSPKPTSEKVWGDLPCQLDRTCDNPALNGSRAEWRSFLTLFLRREKNQILPEAMAFQCGSDFFELGSTVFPAWSHIDGIGLRKLGDFANYVMDFSNCAVRVDADTQMDVFFNNYLNGELK